MPELKHLAEWLGIEVIDVEGEFVVRRQLNPHGAWFEREERATREEVRLYDAVRGLLATATPEAARSPLARVAVVLGVLPPVTIRGVLEKLAGLLADNRHWREKAVGCDAEVVAARKKAADLVQSVEQLKADRWKGHQLASSAYYRNEGEQNAFTMVLHLLKTGEYPL